VELTERVIAAVADASHITDAEIGGGTAGCLAASCLFLKFRNL
jgi:hypothetical protein